MESVTQTDGKLTTGTWRIHSAGFDRLKRRVPCTRRDLPTSGFLEEKCKKLFASPLIVNTSEIGVSGLWLSHRVGQGIFRDQGGRAVAG